MCHPSAMSSRGVPVARRTDGMAAIAGASGVFT
jgi:hypothetical protein